MATLAPVAGTPRPAARQNINSATKTKKSKKCFRCVRRNRSKISLSRRRKNAGRKPRKKRRKNADMPPAQSVADGTKQVKVAFKDKERLGPKQGRPLSFEEARMFCCALNNKIHEVFELEEEDPFVDFDENKRIIEQLAEQFENICGYRKQRLVNLFKEYQQNVEMGVDEPVCLIMHNE